MSTNTTKKKYYIPKNYYEPAMFALRLFKEENKGFNQSVDIAHAVFTNPSHDKYIPPAKLNRNNLSRHLIKYIVNT